MLTTEIRAGKPWPYHGKHTKVRCRLVGVIFLGCRRRYAGGVEWRLLSEATPTMCTLTNLSAGCSRVGYLGQQDASAIFTPHLQQPAMSGRCAQHTTLTEIIRDRTLDIGTTSLHCVRTNVSRRSILASSRYIKDYMLLLEQVIQRKLL